MTVPIKKEEFAAKIKGFKHKELFNYMGWDNDRNQTPLLLVDDVAYHPEIIADKRGFKIITINGAIPAYTTRMKIDKRMKAQYHNHILIFADAKKQEQLWLYSYNDGKKDRKTEIRYSNSQDAERLYQRASGLIFEIDEQDAITIVDVSARVRDNLANNAEKVTKKFYDLFKKEHTKLSGLIKGIDQAADREWYASIMLNRLMFCYFMQRRGFLDNDRQYLRNKLNDCKTKLGKGKFYSFYRSFLLILFQKGFGSHTHAPKIKEMIGRIPYLNGGLFDIHELERENQDIDIPDKAFKAIFDLFDTFEWHLDTRDTATGDEINPDVIGYIFEKYINDRAEMGAYYTQEDITGYISRNAILPYLLNAVKKNHPAPFAPNGAVWKFLKASGDEYIFESVKKGIRDNQGNIRPLPEYVARGLDPSTPKLLERRNRWNEPAHEEYALPTEIWRETVDRRNRYEDVSRIIKTEGITEINDFITYNLNITDFVTDLLDQIEDPQFIMEFYGNLEKLTVLDPTCGSGAFLFAALNILEPLYDSCLSRMEDYINHNYKGSLNHDIKEFFNKKVNLMSDKIHPNKSYFIYKTIILNNLYGVDIMREAAETAKLRLFLKLVSTVDPDYRQENLGIEPLPDIDFNIKAGNTLVGIANRDGIKEAMFGNAFAASFENKINEDMKEFEAAVKNYKRLQLGTGTDTAVDVDTAKRNLVKKQAKLKITLDELLKKGQYNGVKISDKAWRTAYVPFHWVAEFYGIVEGDGGFDVVIGNPPYVEYSKVKNNYQMERANTLLQPNGMSSVIIPLASFSTDRMSQLQHFYKKCSSHIWISNFEATSNPTTLFIGVKVQLSIVITKKGIAKNNSDQIFTTAYKRCYSAERAFLFDKIYYYSNTLIKSGYIIRANDNIEVNIWNKLFKNQTIELLIGEKYSLYYRNMGNFFYKLAFMQEPKYYKNNKRVSSSTVSQLTLSTAEIRDVLVGLINSSLFYYYWILFSDCYHLSKKDITKFHFEMPNDKLLIQDIIALTKKYISSIEIGAIWQTEYKKDGTVKKYRRYFPQKSKQLSDEIDNVLAKHYGFTQEELDYIINYDIKYRMGIGTSNDSNDD
jgi:hypothetical protein